MVEVVPEVAEIPEGDEILPPVKSQEVPEELGADNGLEFEDFGTDTAGEDIIVELGVPKMSTSTTPGLSPFVKDCSVTPSSCLG